MGEYLDLSNWPRKAHFELFRGYELPFFNVCADVDVTETLRWCRDHERSFALACWFACQRTVNGIEAFRYRLRGDRVLVHERIRVGLTVRADDDTFRFGYVPFAETFADFERDARTAMDPAVATVDPRDDDDALIHGSTLPWVRFTSLSHARRLGRGDSVPKIAFGRYFERHGQTSMPVSAEVHHALMDGIHVGRFFERLEAELAAPDETFAG